MSAGSGECRYLEQDIFKWHFSSNAAERWSIAHSARPGSHGGRAGAVKGEKIGRNQVTSEVIAARKRPYRFFLNLYSIPTEMPKLTSSCLI